MRRSHLALLAMLIVGCGSREDAALYVYARNPTLTKGTNAFGSKLDGSVEIFFDLGAYTRGSVTVEAISLGMYRDNKQIVPTAKFEPAAGTTFPFTLAPGSRQTIRYTVTRPQLIDAEPADLCAGPLRITGTVKQSGQGELQVASESVTVSGC